MKNPTELIWEEFGKKLLLFIHSKVKDRDASQDILQDVFIKIHLKLHTLSHRDKLSNWIYQVTRNSILDYFKAKRIYREVKEEDLLALVEEDFGHYELDKCLAPFINNLEEKYREAIEATDLGSLSQREYAEKMNISYSGAKSRIQRAREQLRHLFQECCTVITDSYGNIIERKNCKRTCGCD